MTGSERLTWLNGQITNDLLRHPVNDALYALTLDVRGKIQADLWIYRREDDLVVAGPPDARDALLEHFERFLVMEDAEVAPLDALALITVQGAKPEVPYPTYRAARIAETGFDVLVPVESAEAVVAELAADLGAEVLDEEGWEQRRIEAARPRFGADFGPDCYPQEAGLRDLAVSFHKGCYLGQEVVCMLEHRGALRRRLVQLEGPAGVAGDVLSSGDAEVGALTSVARTEDGVLALGYVKVDKSGGFVEPLTHDGHSFTIRAVVGAGHEATAAL